METLFLIEKVKDNALGFANKVILISQHLGINPDYLMAVMWHESRINPKAKNPLSSATGLIQFLESTAQGLGTSTEALKKMSNVRQLDYVYKYLTPYKGKMKDLTETYLAVFYPYALGKPDTFTFSDKILKVNPVFSKYLQNGKLTKGAIRSYVENYFPSLKKKSLSEEAPC